MNKTATEKVLAQLRADLPAGSTVHTMYIPGTQGRTFAYAVLAYRNGNLTNISRNVATVTGLTEHRSMPCVYAAPYEWNGDVGVVKHLSRALYDDEKALVHHVIKYDPVDV